MIPDIVEIKRLCVSGQWNTKLENGKILLHDTVAGETVCIGNVDAEPVRHGEWIPIMHQDVFGKEFVSHHKCSVCEDDALYECANYDAEEELSNYCPNCGAKMRGDKNAAD